MKDYITETQGIMAELQDEVETTGSIHRNRFDKIGRLMEIIYNLNLYLETANNAAARFAEQNDELNAKLIAMQNRKLMLENQLTILEEELD